MNHITISCIAALVFLLQPQASSQEQINGQPIATTSYGRVRGKYVDAGRGRRVSAFLGIPFAKPPVKELRFAAPEPSGSWNSILEATEYGPACFHENDTFFPGFEGAEMWNSKVKSEDCLYLNIWVKDDISPIENMSIMVWFYGGMFYSGGSSLSIYEGTTLAAFHDVIVVSYNYRAGPLGFLPPIGGLTPGNAGFLDQVMALEWIRDEISNFGGNPKKVTLFGESSGAVSIGLHTVSPLSKGLFDKIILQSGNHLASWATTDMKTSRERMLAMSTNLGCYGDDSAILSCLRSKNESDIFAASWISQDIFDFPFVPVFGTVSIPEDPRILTARGNYTPVNTLLGWNSNEGSYFNVYVLNGFNISSESIITKQQYLDGISNCGIRNSDSLSREAIAFFYSNWKDPSDRLQYRNALDQIVADFHIVCPSVELARIYRKQANVFVYHLSYRLSSNPWPEWMGVMHGYEIEIVFGIPYSLHQGRKYNSRDRQVARRVTQYWTNFAKYGDPNGENTVPSPFDIDDTYWPPVNEENVSYLEISENRNFVHTSPNSFQCALWDVYLPTLQAVSSDWNDVESRWKIQFHRWETSMDIWEKSFIKYSQKQKKGNCVG